MRIGKEPEAYLGGGWATLQPQVAWWCEHHVHTHAFCRQFCPCVPTQQAPKHHQDQTKGTSISTSTYTYQRNKLKGVYLQGECIHISTNSNDGARARANLCNDAGFGNWVCVRYAKLVKLCTYKSTGVVFLESQFWVLVDLPSHRNQPFLLLLCCVQNLFGIDFILLGPQHGR